MCKGNQVSSMRNVMRYSAKKYYIIVVHLLWLGCLEVDLGVPPNIRFSWHLMVFLMKLSHNNHKGCLKVKVYPFRGAAKYFLS